MGFALAYSSCFSCGKTFAFNPQRVPAIKHNGHNEPICAACVTVVNPRRIANGIPPIVVLDGAYEPTESLG